MGYICLICKEKLTKVNQNGQRSPENNNCSYNDLVVTTCGHLYHQLCLHSWLETEKIKQQKITGNPSKALCPLCQEEVNESDNSIRKVYPIDDESEALEKAQYYEKLENLEIYCHQLEINIQQLKRENEIIRGSFASPMSSTPASPMVLDDSDMEAMVLMKNDRIVWIKDRNNPQGGSLLQLTKKAGKLNAKIKLDHKIKLSGRSSGILSSFRSQDKYTITVPFEEVLPEKEYKKLVDKKQSGNLPSPSIIKDTKNFFSKFFVPSNRSSSTLSLPDDLESNYFGHVEGKRRLSGILESEDDIVSIAEAKNPNIRAARSLGSPASERSVSATQSPFDSISSDDMRRKSSIRNSMFGESLDSNQSFEDNRDYVFITPSNKDQLMVSPSTSQTSIRSKSPDPSKLKHVTFAGTDTSKISFKIGDHVMWNDKSERKTKPAVIIEINKDNEVVIEILNHHDDHEHWVPHLIKVQASELTYVNDVSPPKPSTPSPSDIKMKPSLQKLSIFSASSPTTPEDSMNMDTRNNFPAFSPLDMSYPDVFSYVAPLSTPNPFNAPNSLQMTIFEDIEDDIPNTEENSSVFDSTLLALFYGTNIFDSSMLQEKLTDDNLACAVKFILRESFALPLRTRGICDKDYAYKLQDLILHLCSSYIDIEELTTILFEFTFKMPPFIRYSFDMCDYLHQFFIDFTDKNKITTIQHLFNTSCKLQDNLTLKKVPSPALILQIPRSDDKLIHYEAVIPNANLDIGNLIEEGKVSPKLCFCDNVATVECSVCRNIHGDACVLFCDSCCDVLVQLHNGMDHKVVLTPAQSQNRKSASSIRPLKLLAVICTKEDRYTTFLRNGPDENSPWVYIKTVTNGQPNVKTLPELGTWLKELEVNPGNIKTLDNIPPLLRRLLTDGRIFIYHPEILSESL